MKYPLVLILWSPHTVHCVSNLPVAHACMLRRIRRTLFFFLFHCLKMNLGLYSPFAAGCPSSAASGHAP